jgi:hypothetical protein
MSLIAQIAGEAGVSVEGAVRVLTRQPVSEAIEQRVLEALARLDPADQALVRRAATLTRTVVEEGPPDEELATEDSEPDPAEILRTQLDDVLRAPIEQEDAVVERIDEVPDPHPAVDFSDAIRELAGAMTALGRSIQDLRREGESDRVARIEDLAMVVDLIVSGWNSVDRRLGRLERLVERERRVR